MNLRNKNDKPGNPSLTANKNLQIKSRNREISKVLKNYSPMPKARIIVIVTNPKKWGFTTLFLENKLLIKKDTK